MLVFDGGTKLERLEETDGNTAGKILAVSPSAANRCIESDEQKLCKT